ncbi:3-phosphoshikimate 1-carboxyvinyltransferase [Rhodanobacter sp. FW510-R12]|uniref:3-phosphoshikimate 1-carboxyvinyltransferase n=1 Tax=unclassified Rhodanobacter TaxID=2621553 RepID=UPI0007A9DBE6|nr:MULTISPECIES: 3-phosphoshikimate 1-carboxyvinyltransferase [unclassified Rhodanobacter]KZC16047.1 3-phosphoshikimate 1-carboxyvinyltransferase [Rhodanobacter sp. FW104-R8]KZC26573.1 3-phosphoshikimate 1-carboxyvinyltransferase [Rhodanobacter sp. FW510-T8]KZC30442.1 3-phosphoshikimate 1-carboxyvinyltransferase [Rhodanobacter sp. FW510-R10]
MSGRLDWSSRASGPLHGSVRVPGDKSVSHRALMLAAIAEGDSRIRGFLEGEDTRATAAVLAQLGVRIDTPAAGERVVHGVGLHGLRGTTQALDCGNAGTGMRLLTGLLAGQAFDSTLVGDASLSKRPMRRVTDPLALMGARIGTHDGLPPLHVHGGQPLHGIRYELPVPSAQVKSALLLAGLYAEGETEIIEPHPTRDYTERMLAAFGWPIAFAPGRAKLSGGHVLRATDVEVPADFSSAAFFLVAASVVPGSVVRLPAVGLNPRRIGLLQALRLMGADIAVENERKAGGEPVGDLVVRHAPLHGVELPEALVPDMIDEFPALFIAAAVAGGRTVIRGAAELRVKESDRIATMATGLRALGAAIEETPDGAIIHGGRLGGGTVASHLDHRIAMSFAVAGLVAAGPVRINDCSHVATSFPGFLELANGCGFALQTAT